MRTALLLACAAFTVIASQAQDWTFDLGPADGEGYGINGLNEIEPPTVSPAQGDEDPDFPIFYDPVLRELHINIFWGTVPSIPGAEGTPLTSSFGAMHIHGPAGTGGSAGILYELGLTDGFHGEDAGATSGWNSERVVLQANPNSTTFSIQEQEQQLQDGLWYINIHSVNHPNGEIRGQLQLVAVPEPQHYAAFAGLALLGFAGFRRYKNGKAPATA